MIVRIKNILALAGTFLLFFCSKNKALPVEQPFKTPPIAKLMRFPLHESSGVAYSTSEPGLLWVQEDSGNPPQLYLINSNGELVHKSYVKYATNRDWEDMAIDAKNLYIGDIGDNGLIYPFYTVYKLTEPSTRIDTVTTDMTIRFKYPDGSHDAEALLVDPATKDIFIITKNDNPSKVYKLSYPYDLSMNTAAFAGNLPYSGVTSAALSPNGKELIIKTYSDLYYYAIKNNKPLNETIKGAFSKIPYLGEPQGEAISFAYDNSGFYTLSEKVFSFPVSLYFYLRK